MNFNTGDTIYVLNATDTGLTLPALFICCNEKCSKVNLEGYVVWIENDRIQSETDYRNSHADMYKDVICRIIGK